MGSRRAQAQRRERLLAAGLDEELLERIAAPIGLDLGAVTPEETALSIMAEVVAVRNGREGGRLSQRRRAASTRWARDRRPRARGGRGHALRRRRSSSPSSTAARCSSTRSGRCTAAPVGRVVVVLGSGADEIVAGVDLHGAEPLVCSRWDEGQSASLACGLAELARLRGGGGHARRPAAHLTRRHPAA